mmetsp:Transcript_19515/g.29122  ORF Transcript_19515/g.29122 Transcript_19515/m.29122 type:complete len:196 (+) Transcript_19515:50-637(+)
MTRNLVLMISALVMVFGRRVNVVGIRSSGISLFRRVSTICPQHKGVRCLKGAGRTTHHLCAAEQTENTVIEKHRGVRTFMEQGWTILVGKNAADNDVLSTKIGNPNDFWFHVHGCPGSHVVVRNPMDDTDLPREVKRVAAGLAAWYSKAKTSSKASVHYTKCRHVKKIKGSPAGQVQLSDYKAISVPPLDPTRMS